MITAEDDVDRIIAQWAVERPDLRTEAMEVFGRIYRIAHHMAVRQEATYARFGISRGDFDVLATLRRAGEPFQLSPKALSTSLMLTTGGMTGRLDRLERAALITRSPDPVDRRALLVTLSPEGRSLVDDAVAAGLAVQTEALGRLPEQGRAELAGLLRTLLAATTEE
ncbi:MarR family transcriptional regulator [Nonomuraea sp. NBC_01738]|uniref:MarR family winged helix-turn-helix transcriptional regulator n=1 Tax=Nonomuraea sp. NBC_01738 TaxID=2976003 RepID=UPI002E0E6FED|nr:MarR family transcriptional regulator [Nonomuraea sp. NBC_01738]